jgi:protein gp37
VNLNRRPGWLERSNLQQVPPQIWLGSSIESDEFVGRADQLRAIDVPVRFLSLEPLLGPLPSLDLTGISWVIVGGESGPGWRPMDHGWAREIRDRCLDAGVAFYFKQSAAWRTEMGQELDGQRWEQYPLPHPALLKPRQVGVYTDV